MNDNVITIDLSKYSTSMIDSTTTMPTTINTDNITTLSSSHSSTITIDDNRADSITWEQKEFEDCMPGVAKVEDMCKEYPALAKAFENFKTMYALVDQDYKGKQKERKL